MLQDLAAFATTHRLALRIILTEPPTSRWEVRLTTRFLHQPLCAGFGDTLEAAAAECLDKAPRALQSHQPTIERNRA